MRYSFTRRIQEETIGGKRFQYADLGVIDAESKEEAFKEMEKLMKKFEQIIEDEASGKWFEKSKTPMEGWTGSNRAKVEVSRELNNKVEDKINVDEIPF